jgi:Methyltransferase domain
MSKRAGGNRILNRLYAQNPYDGFDADVWPEDIQGWNVDRALFADLIGNTRPTRIIEVGTWKGASAICMARLLNDNGIDGEVVCVDTFLGWPGAPMLLRNGFPMLYWQFLANVLKSAVAGIVTPFPQTSSLAAMWLGEQNVKAGLIYIDGAHGFAQVYDDLNCYWPLVEIGGSVFGDDYDRDDVGRAVRLFARVCRLPLKVIRGKWIFRKVTEVESICAHSHLERAMRG